MAKTGFKEVLHYKESLLLEKAKMIGGGEPFRAFENDLEVNILNTAVVVGVAKHEESSSTICARDADREFNAFGPIFQLVHSLDNQLWDNDEVERQKLTLGSLVTYRTDSGNRCVYVKKLDVKTQVRTILI